MGDLVDESFDLAFNPPLNTFHVECPVKPGLVGVYTRNPASHESFGRVGEAFGTHAALFGVNPWRLQLWMGHKRIDETMRYVHLAEAHRRPLPEAMVQAGQAETDPDRRVLALLGGRGHLMGTRGVLEAKKKPVSDGLFLFYGATPTGFEPVSPT